MGCKASKAAAEPPHAVKPSSSTERSNSSSKKTRPSHAVLFKLLAKAHKPSAENGSTIDVPRIVSACSVSTASYQHPQTLSTPLHLAVRLLDTEQAENAPAIVEAILKVYPDGAASKDASGNIPLHYAIAPMNTNNSSNSQQWIARTQVVRLLLNHDSARDYLARNDCQYDDSGLRCTPLYRAVQRLTDDFALPSATVAYLAMLQPHVSDTVRVGNASDADVPLALLYRRFTRQFDLAEKFFAGDNSRQQVVQHRQRYKTAAGNTWKCIELLLSPTPPPEGPWHLVHRAVQVETPPDLLRYIVETNAEDLTIPDEDGNLPLHYAAMSKPIDNNGAFCDAFYNKYVVDELLYKFPEAASIPNADGKYPLTLAVHAGKQWIGGGIKSLYDAYPQALEQIVLQEHPTLQRALSINVTSSDMLMDPAELGKEEKQSDGGVIADEPHDAIMLVQQESVQVSEVVTSMWAHEEDAGVQMLGCVALSRMVKRDTEDTLRIALSGVAAVVNAMKAHPNEVIVQEKACHALRLLASADLQREVSLVASGAVAAIVGAMQAHVSDAGVQEEACGALGRIIQFGGDDRATIVASVSGLTAICNALAAHSQNVGVQRQGCFALMELTEFPNANLPELPRAQTEPLLESARTKFPDECAESVDVILSRLS